MRLSRQPTLQAPGRSTARGPELFQRPVQPGVKSGRIYAMRITWLVGLLMPIEVLLAGTLVFQDPSLLTWMGVGLLAVIWLSTALVQVPLHQRLGSGFDADVHARLVTSNWIRTVAWTLRGALAVHLLA